ncbi:hypothetical protein K8R32_01830, partial [bacterium]|nr:hypothetical protein [bacterium]
MKKKQKILLWIGVVLACLLVIGCTVYYFWSEERRNKRNYQSQLGDLQGQITKVSGLYVKLIGKKKEIFLTKDKLYRKIKTYRKEVLQSSKIKNLDTYARAEK